MQAEAVHPEDRIREMYPQLRNLARRFLRAERQGHTLQPTALVNETLLRLGQRIPGATESVQSFLRIAAHQMRQILVDYGRRHGSLKRGGGLSRIPLQENHSVSIGPWRLVELNVALERLGKIDSRALAVVELKFFAGCTNDETAAILGVSDGTVESAWTFARLWLLREISEPTRANSGLVKVSDQHDVVVL